MRYRLQIIGECAWGKRQLKILCTYFNKLILEEDCSQWDSMGHPVWQQTSWVLSFKEFAPCWASLWLAALSQWQGAETRDCFGHAGQESFSRSPMAAEIVWGLGSWGSGVFQGCEHMPHSPAKCRRPGLVVAGPWGLQTLGGVAPLLMNNQLLFVGSKDTLQSRHSGGMWELNIQAHNGRGWIPTVIFWH